MTSVTVARSLAVVFVMLLCMPAGPAAARLSVPAGEDTGFSFASYYGDHMVLQQAPQQAVIWGHAPTSALGQSVSATVGKAGQVSSTVVPGPEPNTAVWKIKLPPMDQHGPFMITVKAGSTKLMLNDVLFGDVWVCSGQSNMQFSMIQVFNATKEIEEVSSYPDIRVFTVALRYSAVPLYELLQVEEKWSVPTPASIGNKVPFSYFSAVCWLYGKYLYEKLGYPIGLVDTDWGGTPVEAWSSPDALAKCGLDTQLLFRPKPPPNTRLSGQDDKSQLYNAMIHPILNMTIYGAIWYQGEANAGRPNTYNCSFPAMISDWRLKFNEGSLGETSNMFPFGFVQLCANRNDSSIVTGFPDIRWHQTADMGYVPNPLMENVFMSVAMDLPDFTSPYGSVHPRDKQDMTRRLALSGLSVAYNLPDIKFQGPLITAFYIDVGFSTLGFDYDNGTSPIVVRSKQGFETDEDLKAGFFSPTIMLAAVIKVCCSTNNQSSCDSDTDPHWRAVPIIKSDVRSVTLSYKTCGQAYVVGLRYAWRESPCPFKQCAVYSKENELPAPPFIINGLIGLKIKTWEHIQIALRDNKM